MFVADKVDENDKYWLCFTDFLKCLYYILSPALTHGAIIVMNEQIQDFLLKFRELNGGKLKPKAHNMIHYASQYQHLGPLIHFSTMRFEGKHANLKSIFGTCKNFKNPCSTIATRHQYLQAFHRQNRDFLSINNIIYSNKFSSCKISDFTNLSDCPELKNLPNNMNIQVYSNVQCNGITYEKGCIVLLGFDDDYRMAMVENAFRMDGFNYLIVKNCNIIEYNCHKQYYILETSKVFTAVKLCDLLSECALPSYKDQINDTVIIRIPYYVLTNLHKE